LVRYVTEVTGSRSIGTLCNSSERKSAMKKPINQSTMPFLFKSLFCRLFKRSTGISPHQFVIQQRVDRAKQLLQKTDRSVLDVAIHCGFTDGKLTECSFISLSRQKN
jgi:methylphosphotriester-DNA--protein-cysteine methyltransferase